MHRQLGILALIKKDQPGSQKEFMKAWERDPHSKRLLETILAFNLAKEQIGPTIDFLQHEIQNRPNDPLLYHEIAQVYLIAGKQNEAISALQKALSLAPDSVPSASLLADTYISAKQPGQALRLIAGLMQKHSEESDAHAAGGHSVREAAAVGRRGCSGRDLARLAGAVGLGIALILFVGDAVLLYRRRRIAEVAS